MTRPNILILYTDQQRFDALGASGNPHIRTPNLDRLAADGVRFSRHFVQNPVCMPSRVSFLTGRYPSSLGITHMGVPVPEDLVTLPHLLGRAGYHCANVGKLHFLPHANRDHREPHPAYGFHRLEIADEPGPYEDAYRAWVRQRAPDQLDRVSLGLPPATARWQQILGVDDGIAHPETRFPKRALPFGADSDLTHTAFVADRCLDVIAAHRTGEPFLCIGGFYSPHSPWVAPQEFIDLYDDVDLPIPSFPPALEARRRELADDPDATFGDDELRQAAKGYYAMVSEVDHHVGRVLAGLDAAGLADNTLVVFTSDHGEWLGEHLRYGKGFPAHDCVSRVPLLIRWPAGVRRPGRAVEPLVEAVDVLPTLLEAAGVQTPPAVQGASLLAALRDEAFAGKPLAVTEMTRWRSVRTGRHRYVIEADGTEQLFDLEVDPAAYEDLSATPRAQPLLADLRRQLLQHQLASARPRPRDWVY